MDYSDLRTYHGEPDMVEGQKTALSKKKYCHRPSFSTIIIFELRLNAGGTKFQMYQVI